MTDTCGQLSFKHVWIFICLQVILVVEAMLSRTVEHSLLEIMEEEEMAK